MRADPSERSAAGGSGLFKSPMTKRAILMDSPLKGDPLGDADNRRRYATTELDQEKRGDLGQFLTPADVARLMASMFEPLPNDDVQGGAELAGTLERQGRSCSSEGRRNGV